MCLWMRRLPAVEVHIKTDCLSRYAVTASQNHSDRRCIYRGQLSCWAAFTLQGIVLYFLHIHFVLCSKNKCKLCLLKSEIHFNISDMILGAVIFIYVVLILLSSKILKFLILNFIFLTSVIFLNLSPF